MVEANLTREEFAESPTIAAPNSPRKFIKVDSQSMSANGPSGRACPTAENIPTKETASTAEAIKRERINVIQSERGTFFPFDKVLCASLLRQTVVEEEINSWDGQSHVQGHPFFRKIVSIKQQP